MFFIFYHNKTLGFQNPYSSAQCVINLSIPNLVVNLFLRRFLELTEEPFLTESENGREVKILTHNFYVPNDYLYLVLEEQCHKGTNYTLMFPQFRGELGAGISANGFYRIQFKNSDGNDM